MRSATKEGASTGPMFSEKNTDQDVQESDKKWQDIIMSVDTDGDGMVNFEEFKNAIQSFLD